MHDIEQPDLSELFDVTAAEKAEKQLTAFINARSKAKERANEEEELWKASERRVQERRRRENREAWLQHYEMMNRLHLEIAQEHASRRSRLLAEDYTGLDEGPGGEAA